MRVSQIIFDEPGSFKKQLKNLKGKCDSMPHCNVIFYLSWTDRSKDDLGNAVNCIDKYFPDAIYYGNEASGSIQDGDLTYSVAVTCYMFEEPDTRTELVWVEEGTDVNSLWDLWDICKKAKGLKAVELIPSISYLDTLRMDDSIPDLDKDVLIFGGASVNYDNPSFEADIIAKGHPVTREGMAVILYFGERLSISATSVLGWKGLGRYMKVTKSRGKIINEIDGVPAHAIYEKYLNLKDDDTDNLVFPLIVEEDGVEYIRTPQVFLPDKSMRMFVNIREGALTRIAYGDKNTILDSLYEKSSEIAAFNPQAIKAYSCAARRLFWGDQEVCKETLPLQEIAPVCGFYTGGEILRFGLKMKVLNSTLCLVCFKEGEGNVKEAAIQYKKKDTSLLSRITYFMEEIAREREDALSMAQSASRAKTSFLNNMSHDIRTPMNAIKGFTEMAKENLDDKEKISEYLDKIDISSQQLLGLINQVLEMSRIESGKVQINEKPVDIQDEYDSLITILSEQTKAHGLEFHSSLKDIEHFNVLADNARMSQIALNIAGNAIKFTPEGGRIDFTFQEKPCSRPGYAVYTLTIQDTGIGMSKEFLNVLYEPFCREGNSTVSKIQGTGLGMSIVKNIVDMLGGDIQVESELGKGTRFDVTIGLKIDDGERAASAPAGKAVTGSFQGKRILLVEDNGLNREIARFILEENGFQIEEAEDGDIAVRMLKSQYGKGDFHHFDIILMDIQMPHMDGYEATRQIREMSREDPDIPVIPIIAMTANAFDEDRRQALEAGMNEHIAKPIDKNGLLETLARFL